MSNYTTAVNIRRELDADLRHRKVSQAPKTLPYVSHQQFTRLVFTSSSVEGVENVDTPTWKSTSEQHPRAYPSLGHRAYPANSAWGLGPILA